MLLSRSAEDIYWLGRHLERAEGTARFVREHSDLLVDLPASVDNDWSPLLAITGSDEPFALLHDEAHESNVVTYLVADPTNSGSLRRSLENARENLRCVRPSMPTQVWNSLTRLSLDLSPLFDKCGDRTARSEVCERVIETCQRIDGVIAGSMSHGMARNFLELGRLVERVDLATRVLDVRAVSLLRSDSAGMGSPYSDVRWLGVLRSLNAQEMYRRASTLTLDGTRCD